MKVIQHLAAALALACLASADDYQCTSDQGCAALLPAPGGTKVVKFKKGDIVSTSSGFIVDPSAGWKRVNCPEVEIADAGALGSFPGCVVVERAPALAGLLPLGWGP